MELNVNDGSRPSKFRLDQLAAGDLSSEEEAALREQLSPEALAHLASIESSRGAVAPLDIAALHARSAPVAAAPPALPKVANLRWIGAFLAIAAAFLVMVLVPTPGEFETPVGYDGIRGGSSGLQLYNLDGDVMRPYDNLALGAGDVVAFRVNATDHHTVVLLSVDGNGEVNVYWPEHLGPAEPLRGSSDETLPGSLTLDDAPGPEVFIAVYDQSVQAATEQVNTAWKLGGDRAIMQWVYDQDDVDAQWVQRR